MGGRTVTLAGPDGEPFVRLSPRGAEVNVRSPAWVPLAQARNRDLLGDVVDPRAKPTRVLLTSTPELTGRDPRLLPARALPALGRVFAARRPIDVAAWRIPIEVGSGSAAEIRGTARLAQPAPEEPPPQASAPATTGGEEAGTTVMPLAAGLVAMLLVLAGARLVLRARR